MSQIGDFEREIELWPLEDPVPNRRVPRETPATTPAPRRESAPSKSPEKEPVKV